MPSPHPQPSWIAAAPVLFVLMWATGFVVARLSAPHADPLSFLSFRFAMAGLILAGIAAVTGARWPRLRQAVHAAVSGILIHAGYLGPVYWSVAHGMPAGVSALIVGLQPLITALVAAHMVGERIVPRHWLGLAAGLAGVGLVVSPQLALAGLSGITPATTVANIAGAISIALGTVYQKRHATALDLAPAGAIQYFGAMLVAGLWAALTEEFRFDQSLNAWVALFWSVAVLSLGAISLLMLLIRHGEVARVSGLIFLVPAVTALMAYGLFDETLSAIQMLGMAVCAGAVFLVTGRRAGR